MKELTTTKAFWYAIILSAIVFLATWWTAILKPYTTPYWIESLGYFILTYSVLLKFTQKNKDINTWVIAIAIIIGRLIIEIPFRIGDFSSSLISLMITISCIIAIILASICYKYKTIYSFILAYIILSLFNSAVAEMWNNIFFQR